MIPITDYVVKGSALKEKIEEKGWVPVANDPDKGIVKISIGEIQADKWYNFTYTLFEKEKAIQLTETAMLQTAEEMDEWAF